MRILLVRHGESLGNIDQTVHARLPDHAIPLSDKGLEQAQEAGRFLSDYYGELSRRPALIRIWTSPYERTRQTAKCILKEMAGLPVDIREHVNLCEQQFGLFDGVPDAARATLFPHEHTHYTKCEQHEGRFWARMPLGESRFDVAVRIHEAFGTFHRDADRHGINDLIIICHGVSLRAFIMQWFNRSPEWFDAEPNPGNCSIRLIEDGEDKGFVYKYSNAEGEA